MLPLRWPAGQSSARWAVVGKGAREDAPWQSSGGEALARGSHSCMPGPQTHVDSVSLALPALVKVRQHDMVGGWERERRAMMDSVLHPPLVSLPLIRLVTFQ